MPCNSIGSNGMMGNSPSLGGDTSWSEEVLPIRGWNFCFTPAKP